MPRNSSKRAVDLTRQALSGNFEDSFIDRVADLVRSSNRSFFRDALSHMLGGAAEAFALGSGKDLAGFSKLVADTRNAVVHMTDNDEGKLDEAFARVNKLSLKLCFWCAVWQAHHLRLPVPAHDIKMFLLNNRNARHGLPNELLDEVSRHRRRGTGRPPWGGPG
jgi:hypothetical protein